MPIFRHPTFRERLRESWQNRGEFTVSQIK